MNKKELVKVENEEKELFSKEEKIELIKDVFEYCKKHYGLKDYSICIMDSKRSSSYKNYNMDLDVKISNNGESFLKIDDSYEKLDLALNGDINFDLII